MFCFDIFVTAVPSSFHLEAADFAGLSSVPKQPVRRSECGTRLYFPHRKQLLLTWTVSSKNVTVFILPHISER
ncbi:hypothetical protein AVEN_222445-1, partial [Araneus ventricosus]